MVRLSMAAWRLVTVVNTPQISAVDNTTPTIETAVRVLLALSERLVKLNKMEFFMAVTAYKEREEL